MEKIDKLNNKSNKKRIDSKDNILYMLPKYEKYMEYMLDTVVSKLPRIEKFNLGNEIKTSMFETVKYILILSKVDKINKLAYLNMLDASICVQRIYIRIMYKRRYLDNKRYMYIMEMLSEIGKMVGGYIKWVSK